MTPRALTRKQQTAAATRRAAPRGLFLLLMLALLLLVDRTASGSARFVNMLYMLSARNA